MSSNSSCFLKTLFPPMPQANIMALAISKEHNRRKKMVVMCQFYHDLHKGRGNVCLNGNRYKWKIPPTPPFKQPEHLQLFIKPVKTKDSPPCSHCRQWCPAVLWLTQATGGHKRAKALTVFTSSPSKQKVALLLLLSNAPCSQRYYSSKGKQPY